MKCAIQWIDSAGKPTPDENDAVAMVYMVAHTQHLPGGSTYHAPESQHYPCCAEHLARLSEPGMGHWVREPLPTWGRPDGSVWLDALSGYPNFYNLLELYVYTTQCQATGFDNLAAERSIGWLASPAGAAMRVSAVYADGHNAAVLSTRHAGLDAIDYAADQDTLAMLGGEL